MIEIAIERLNRLSGNSLTYMREDSIGKRFIVEGHYHLDCAYGGYKLVQTDNNAGGIRTISNNGYTTKRDLYNQIQMYIKGYESALEANQ